MTLESWPATADLLEAFSADMLAAGGTVVDTYHDGVRLFARATLPALREVRPGDGLRGGVAVRATAEELRVHPYVFRLVCSNGAISARATQSWRIERDDLAADPDRSADDVLAEFREAVRACSADEAFASAAEGMRSATFTAADQFVNVLPMLSQVMRHLSPKQAGQAIEQILGRFERDGDRSRFGLMNAVTATARDTRDPDLRWRLEEFGGGIPSLAVPADRGPRGPAAAACRSAEMAGAMG